MIAVSDIEEGRQVFGWTLAAFGPSFTLGVPWPFGPLHAFPATRYVMVKELKGKGFQSAVVIGEDVPSDQVYPMIAEHVFAADEALDEMLGWTVPTR